MSIKNKFQARLLTPTDRAPRLLVVLVLLWTGVVTVAQDSNTSSITPLPALIEKQRQRLSSTDAEERRDAVMRLGSLHHPAASRVAATALADSSVAVRVAAAMAIVYLPPDESAALLLPLLADKIPFVRQETAYALGMTRSKSAVTPLTTLLGLEKDSGVRAAVAVSLGQVGDETAVVSLALLLAPDISATTTKKKKSSNQENEFVMRAAARSLGQIGSRSGVPALMAALQNEGNAMDIRRAAAVALGLIGAPEAVPALRSLLTSTDPYLSLAAQESLQRIAAN